MHWFIIIYLQSTNNKTKISVPTKRCYNISIKRQTEIKIYKGIIMKALLIVDIQKGLTKRELYNKEIFINTVKQVIGKSRDKDYLIIYIRHENKQLVSGTSDWEVDDNLPILSGDMFFPKTKGDAFSNKELVKHLNESSVKDVIVCGLVTHGCIKHTCLGGVKAGYNVALVKNAHSNWAADAQEKIAATEKLLFEEGVKLLDVDNL